MKHHFEALIVFVIFVFVCFSLFVCFSWHRNSPVQRGQLVERCLKKGNPFLSPQSLDCCSHRFRNEHWDQCQAWHPENREYLIASRRGNAVYLPLQGVALLSSVSTAIMTVESWLLLTELLWAAWRNIAKRLLPSVPSLVKLTQAFFFVSFYLSFKVIGDQINGLTHAARAPPPPSFFLWNAYSALRVGHRSKVSGCPKSLEICSWILRFLADFVSHMLSFLKLGTAIFTATGLFTYLL